MTIYDKYNPNPYGSQFKVVELVGENKKVLEVGCASGRISKRLAKNGCEVIGIEIDDKSAKRAAKYCKNVINEDVEKLPDLKDYNLYFDVILLSNVLEHLKSPSKVLKNLKGYLKKDGFAIIVLPNIAHISIRIKLLSGNFKYKESGILDKTHLRFFYKKTAENIIINSGYEIIDMDFVPSIPFIYSQKVEYQLAKAIPNLFSSEFIIKAKRRY
ncbi:MAG: class I SAM-dependent methyltransferase [Methanobacterium sp.]|jgi:2-polyprenyl-3-methyl-5-hydroxy-6-metoxy-1,4-benzoquinol methylase